MSSGISSIISIGYIVAGPVVASGHGFFETFNAMMPILSAVSPVVLWPLVRPGVDLDLR